MIHGYDKYGWRWDHDDLVRRQKEERIRKQKNLTYAYYWYGRYSFSSKSNYRKLLKKWKVSGVIKEWQLQMLAGARDRFNQCRPRSKKVRQKIQNLLKSLEPILLDKTYP